MKFKKISNNQLKRYPTYLKYLILKKNAQHSVITSKEIAKDLKYSDESVRKDLQLISSNNGTPGLGRDINSLINDLESFLGYHERTNAIIIGVGKLGKALMSYAGFNHYGIKICAGFDKDKELIGKKFNSINVYDYELISDFIKENNIEVAIICVPIDEAQKVVDLVTDNGVKAIYNFSPVFLIVKDDVIIENIDIASSIAFLSAKLKMKGD